MAPHRPLRVGVLFGGRSREREIAFAGGRTVVDLLDRRLFTPLPLFVDGGNRLVQLDTKYLYRGTLRDFLPPAHRMPPGLDYQVYPEQVNWEDPDQEAELLQEVGTPRRWTDLPGLVDVVFLVLHGLDGEDGSIQGLLDWIGVPYTGTGSLGSALGVDKIHQRQLMERLGYDGPRHLLLRPAELANAQELDRVIRDGVGYPCVFKHPTQGSSIGVAVARNLAEAEAALQAVAFRHRYTPQQVAGWTADDRQAHVQRVLDYRAGVGLPAWWTPENGPAEWLVDPRQLEARLANLQAPATLQAPDAPEQILVEAFVEGREFSVVVIETPAGAPLALPPTEIMKADAVYDYRGKYLAGQARKRTPMPLPETQLRRLAQVAEGLKRDLFIDVYARLDGILTPQGKLIFNDPNTTSGMLPSSFFFHQAAEVGLTPSELLTYIVYTSLQTRLRERGQRPVYRGVFNRLEAARHQLANAPETRTPVAVILGGDSTERHVSLESGRNVTQKLQAGGRYAPVPLFLLNHSSWPQALQPTSPAAPNFPYSLWRLPVPYLLKDNADDVAQRLLEWAQASPADRQPKPWDPKAEAIARRFSAQGLEQPELVDWATLPQRVKVVFLALHGRPGEDGQLQTLLDQLGLPYNGSAAQGAALATDKYAANRLLAEHGLQVPPAHLVDRQAWLANPQQAEAQALQALPLPLVAKPQDEGCSSAVKVIRNAQGLHTYLAAVFRAPEADLTPDQRAALGLATADPFPPKPTCLLEGLVAPRTGWRLLEVTVGVLNQYNAQGERTTQVLEPSEAVAQGGILSLQEKFLAGEGQNLTPARLSPNPVRQARYRRAIQAQVAQAAELLGLDGYARLDAFVYLPEDEPEAEPEVVFIEANALPGLTPATCLFHQAAFAGLAPIAFLETLLDYAQDRHTHAQAATQPAHTGQA